MSHEEAPAAPAPAVPKAELLPHMRRLGWGLMLVAALIVLFADLGGCAAGFGWEAAALGVVALVWGRGVLGGARWLVRRLWA